jgi:type I restriction enzyme R subunit
MPDDYTEDTLVEQPAIALFAELGYETVNCFHEAFGERGTLGRETSAEVVLKPRLRLALERLNPDLPHEAIQLAVEELMRDRSALSMVQANREIYQLLRDGVKVAFREDEEITETVRVIDWNTPENNDFFLASQFWISGEMYKRRADLIGFVNGLPLVFIELKASHRRLEHAYKDNLRDYKRSIPQVFWYNAFIILSNGSQSRIGSMTADWEHFAEWKKINSEGEQGIVSLETVIRGTCDKTRLLDLVENFTLFSDASGSLIKLVAKNHQFLGVNNAIEAVGNMGSNRGRLGVFWHTQGSGKSYSMVFFSQKVLRKIPGNWTFLIVTDRQELDDQIYKTFASVGAVTEQQVQATSGEHLKQLLQENHRNIFTLIQKFHIERGRTYPKLSDRSDIIVMTDEAHRSQYDILALNMRNALPNAAFIGFTGTPLMAGEEKTREVFGDYVSIYNFRQSIEDGATVPLYYENRIPELQLINENLNEDLERLIDAANLDEDQQRKLEREFRREYHLITRDERLEKIAEDIVAHFMGRGELGKAMVVSIDKMTAVRMYDKVQRYWQQELERLKHNLNTVEPLHAAALLEKIKYMEETGMAVVVSSAQNEVEDFEKRGLDITRHRRRMQTEDLETKFKDPNDPFRIVFVCAMWMTGFDVPSLSTVYLDKPMRNHTLMQTIARANRVFAGKLNGLIVDYIGVFRDLQKALAIYGSAAGGGANTDEMPVKDKQQLVVALRQAIAETTTFCIQHRIDPQTVLAAQGFERLRLIDDAVEAIIVNDESKKKYLFLAANVVRLYKAILPNETANGFTPLKSLFAYLADKIRGLTPAADIDHVLEQVEELLDSSIATEGYVIHEHGDDYKTKLVELSQIDFEALKAHFNTGRRRTEAEKLKGAINSKLKQLVRLNKSRQNYLEQFQALIDEYNAGSMNVELFFDKLIAFAKRLTTEEQRSIAEQLTEEELAVFDLLTKPDMNLSKNEKKQVKQVARELLAVLKEEKLVLDWRKRQQSRAQVLITIQDVLDRGLPRSYTPEVYEQKCDAVYQHIYDSYYGQERSIYSKAA